MLHYFEWLDKNNNEGSIKISRQVWNAYDKFYLNNLPNYEPVCHDDNDDSVMMINIKIFAKKCLDNTVVTFLLGHDVKAMVNNRGLVRMHATAV